MPPPTAIASRKVILIDDEPDSLKLAHDILELNGIEVYSALNATQFRELWGKVEPDLFIVDLSMPELDGWGILSEIRAAPSSRFTPVVAVTAFHSDKVSQAADRAGFTLVIPKPLRAASFLEEMRRILGDT